MVIGANDLTHLGQEVEVHTIRRAILHEYFNNRTMINDIALLELDQPVQCSYYIQLACVPDASLRVSELTDCYVSGWGHMGLSWVLVAQGTNARPHGQTIATCPAMNCPKPGGKVNVEMRSVTKAGNSRRLAGWHGGGDIGAIPSLPSHRGQLVP